MTKSYKHKHLYKPKYIKFKTDDGNIHKAKITKWNKKSTIWIYIFDNPKKSKKQPFKVKRSNPRIIWLKKKVNKINKKKGRK